MMQLGGVRISGAAVGLTLAGAGYTLQLQLEGVYVSAITVLRFSHCKAPDPWPAVLQMCPRPEVVEVWDVTSPDPRLLVWLKVRRHCRQLMAPLYTLLCCEYAF